MKKSKIVIAASALLLFAGGFFVTKAKANKKFTANSAYFEVTGTWFTLFSGATATQLTTVNTAGKTARVKTAGGNYTLRTGKSTTDKAWFY
jgi:hypothetical protein